MKAIAIDGPAGAGKSTIARRAAKELGYIYVDTGALYRAVGWYMSSRVGDTRDGAQVVPLLPEVRVELRFQGGEQRVFVNGEDVSDRIRTPEMSMHASNVSAIPEVRKFLFDLQQDIARTNNVIMDGRDIGTVVLPWADVKIFLTATPEDRARRRYQEHLSRGEQVEYEQLLREVRQRDEQDTNRAAAPLRQAEDAVLLDTTGNELERSIALVLGVIRDRLAAEEAAE